MTSKRERFKQLTWADVQRWAGDTIASRGRSYQRSDAVEKLALTPAGAVIAWVQGTETYATLVDIEGGNLTSACSCPYDGTCKHAVAVVLEYMERLDQDGEVPATTAGDARLALLGQAAAGEPVEDEDADEQDEQVSDERMPRAVPKGVRSYLEQQTKEQLVALLEDMAGRYPSVSEALKDRADLSKGTVARMVTDARKQIAVLSANPGWSHHWDDEGYVPDYSGVRDRLQALLDAGHADEVVALGKELFEAGCEQVDMSDDEGETATEISRCMNVVFQALPRSSLPPAEQLLWAVEADLKDDHELCHGAGAFWDSEHAAGDWNTVAEVLLRRLEEQRPAKGEDSHSGSYDRDQLTGWIMTALEEAGRKEEIIPLCEREVRETDSYVRLVNELIEADRKGDAEHWIREGIKATKKRLPGIAHQLHTIMREMREKERDWPQVAAFRAAEFFAEPSLGTFQELQKAAEQAGVWPEVGAAAMLYLETGALPRRTEKAGGKVGPSWPLPETGVEAPAGVRRSDFPLTGTLIDIAIAEKRPDEVVRWYDRNKLQRTGWGWSWDSPDEDVIAGAIVEAYPERALEIWKRLAESHIAETKPRAYEVAAGFMRSICRTLKKLDREQEWDKYLMELRQNNVRKRRLVEILNRFAKPSVVDRRPATPPPGPQMNPLL